MAAPTHVDYHDKLFEEHRAFREHPDKNKINRNIWCCQFCGRVKSHKVFQKELPQTCQSCAKKQSNAHRYIQVNAARMVRLNELKIQQDAQHKKEEEENHISELDYDPETLLSKLKERRDGYYLMDDIDDLMQTYVNSNGMENAERYGPTFCGQLAQICYNMKFAKDTFEDVNLDAIILV